MVAAVPDERTEAVERVGTALEDFHEGKGRRGLELPSSGREVMLVLVLVLRRRRGTEVLEATPVSVVEDPVAVEGRPSVTVTVPVPLVLLVLLVLWWW